MANSDMIIVVWLIGSVVSFFIPYLLKIWNGKIMIVNWQHFFTQMDWRYIVTAAATFFLGVLSEWDVILVDILKYSEVVPEWKAYILTFLSASGILVLLNKAVKSVEIQRSE